MTKLERWEVICGLAWFTSDGCWLLVNPSLCYLAATIAWFAGVMIAFNTKRERLPMLICAGDSSWLMFNISWSFGDLSSDPEAIAAAKMLFGLGALFYALAFVNSGGHQMILRRLRLLRLIGLKGGETV